MLQKHLRRASAVVLYLLVLLTCFVRRGYSQTFDSGSTGADGALNLTTPGTIIFDPVALGLHPAVENVFNFTTINISAGVTVKLTSKVLRGPVYWLAQGAVTNNGTIDANGETGHPRTNNMIDRVSAAGGAGGYSGGVGGSVSLPPTSGNGPGGSPGVSQFVSGTTVGGIFTGSQYLIPLIGGSGGGGASPSSNCLDLAFGAGGGGGGGAILIASSVSINTGIITAVGGNAVTPCGSGNPGGAGGSGGAIRLMAPTITLPNIAFTINAKGGGGSFGQFNGGDGVVRLEAFNLVRPSPSNDVGGHLVTSPPFMVVPPAAPPSSIKVTSINGIPINANPFSFPDVTINSPTPVTVNVQAQFIPLGTIPKILVTSETGPDQTVNCSALAGTLQQSTCSAQIPFPTGGSRGFVKATWQ